MTDATMIKTFFESHGVAVHSMPSDRDHEEWLLILSSETMDHFERYPRIRSQAEDEAISLQWLHASCQHAMMGFDQYCRQVWPGESDTEALRVIWVHHRAKAERVTTLLGKNAFLAFIALPDEEAVS